jgi:hypothetical protein
VSGAQSSASITARSGDPPATIEGGHFVDRVRGADDRKFRQRQAVVAPNIAVLGVLRVPSRRGDGLSRGTFTTRTPRSARRCSSVPTTASRGQKRRPRPSTRRSRAGSERELRSATWPQDLCQLQRPVRAECVALILRHVIRS